MNALGSPHEKVVPKHIWNNIFSSSNEDFEELQHLSREEAIYVRLKRLSKAWQRIIHAPLFYSVVLEVLLAIIVTTMTIITWTFASTHAEHSVAAVSDSLRSELLEHAEVSAKSILERNNESAILLARLMGSSVIKGNLSSFTTLEDQVGPALFLVYSTVPYTSQVFYMGKNGLFMSYYSDFSETFILFANTSQLSPYTSGSANISEPRWDLAKGPTPNSPGYLWYRQSANVTTGLPIGEAIPTGAFALWSTKWFHNALFSEHGFAAWGLGFDESKELLFLSLASVKDVSTGEPFGVVALGVSMKNLTNFFMFFNLHGGDMYLATKDGYLLAQTGSSSDVGAEPDKPMWLEATKSRNAVVAGAALYLSNKFKNISKLGSETFRASDVNIQGERYILDSAPLPLAGTTLVFVMVIPYKSIWGPMKMRSHTTLVLIVVLAGCMFLVSSLFVVLLTRAASKEMHLCAALIQQLEATKQAERKSNHKSIVFASTSHDLRTSLAAIIGLIDLCRCDAVEGSELEANLLQMNSCATNLLGILNSVLDMSKIEAGKLQLEEVDFDIVQVLEEVVDMFSVVALKKGLEVVLDLCDESVEKVSCVRGDAGRLKQILSNLLSNGVKYTTEGHVVLRAWVKQVSPGNPSARESHSGQFLTGLWNCMSRWFSRDAGTYKQISACSEVQSDPNYVEFMFEVDDTGKGVPKDRRKAVFENFVQVDESTARRYDSTGLGLGIVRSLVHLMNGDIAIVDKDEPGEQGTCFRFNAFFRKTESKLSVVKRENEVNHSACMQVLDGASVRDTFGSSGTSHIQDWHSGLNAEAFASPCKSPPLAEGVHVVLAMRGEAGKKIMKKWMERRGLQVWMVGQWEDFIPTLEKLKHEILFNSYSASEDFELVSPESHLSAPWVDEPDLRGQKRAEKTDYHIQRPATAECGSTSEVFNKTNMNRMGAYLLVLIDITVISDPLEQVSVILSNLSEGGQMLQYKVAWLATANTPTVDLQNLRRGLVPCDLILHKPVHGSRLHAIWELVQDLTGTRTLCASEIKSLTVLPEMHTNTDPCRTESFYRPTFNLTNLQDQRHMRLELKQNDGISKPQNSLEGMHILVAEDNAVLRRLAQTMLVRLGATVECVDNGAEAVELVSNVLRRNVKANKDIYSFQELSQEASAMAKPYAFDIVLMDCEMPVLDGYEATRRIREEERHYGCHIPIIALTAHAMAQEESKSLQAGMDFHLTKPLAVQSLLNTVAKIYSQ